MARRHSRTPMVLTKTEQEALVRAIDASDERIGSIELALEMRPGDWKDLTFGEKVIKIHEMQELGYALGSIAGALRGERDFEREVLHKRGNGSLEDRVAMLENQNQMLIERLAERDAEIHRLRTISALRGNPTEKES